MYKVACSQLLGLSLGRSDPLFHAKFLDPWTSAPLQNIPAHSPDPKTQWPGGKADRGLGLEEGLMGKSMFLTARLTSGEGLPLFRVQGCQGSSGVSCFGVEHEWCGLGKPNLSLG